MMGNYEYIIAGLPDSAIKGAGGVDVDATLAGIIEMLDPHDAAAAGILMKGFRRDDTDAGFYREAAGCGNRFIRDYFRYDMNVRNVKVEWLNSSLGRPAGTDVMIPEDDAADDFTDRKKVLEVLEGHDILAREKGMDDIMWDKADELTALSSPFCLDVILASMVKLNIAGRWLRLDPDTGRALFRKMVSEIKENYTI